MKAVQCSVCGRIQPILKEEPVRKRSEWEAKRERWFLVEGTGQVICGGSPNKDELFDACLRGMVSTGDRSKVCLNIFLPGLTGAVPKGIPTIVIQEGEPLCEKCGGKTVVALMPETFAFERKCVECEMKIVSRDKDGTPIHLVPR